MRTLLIVMTVAAVSLPLLMYSGLSVVGAAMIAMVVAAMYFPPICLGALALYCRGHRQTFWLGAFAGSMLQTFIGGDFIGRYFGISTATGIITLGVVQVLACFACGYAALATRRFVERRGWNTPDDRQLPPVDDVESRLRK